MSRYKIPIPFHKLAIFGYHGRSGPFEMSRDFVADLRELSSTKVHIKNRDEVNRLIGEIVNGGTRKLQVVSDFDQTLTKQHEDGKKHLSSFGIFARCKSLPKTYLEDERLLSGKYFPIEVDPSIPYELKKPLMEEWWTLSEKLLKGLRVSVDDINEVVAEMCPALRDGCLEAIKTLHKDDVPVLVFSAGLGDTVVAVLKYYNILLPNVKVISNFLERDENEIIQGFSGGRTIHVYNKNEFALEGTEYHKLIEGRGNVILMGDSLGDAGMANGVENANAVLKIGFLYQNAAGNLPAYMNTFDIVLEDDQTMDILNAILSLLQT